ncbi:MAG TPA: ROK family protein [Actinocrinis sp.]
MTDRAIRSPRDLRRSNRSLLLRRLYLDGPLSRQDMIDSMGASAASVSNVVADLIADGAVVEAGIAGGGNGRPRTLLRVDTESRFVVGVEVGETHIQVRLLTLGFDARAAAEIPMPGGIGDARAVAREIAAGVREVTAALATRRATNQHPTMHHPTMQHPTILGVGIAVPGVVESRPDAVVHCQTVGWDAVPLERMLRREIDLPLYIDNGATALGQAEMWFGAGRGCSDAVIALIGVGVGACVVTDGVPYRGVGHSAGEWGHTVVEVGGRRCRCGSLGCLEAYVGAGAIRRRYRELASRESLLPLPGFDDLGDEAALAAIVAASEGPDARAEAVEALDEAAVYLGAGVASLINLFNPERIVLGGWAGVCLGSRLLPRIREVAAEYALRHAYSSTSIDLCRLGTDAVARGAACLPVAEYLASGGAPTRVPPVPEPAG